MRTDGLSTLLISVYTKRAWREEEAGAVEFSVCSIFFRYQACWVVSLCQLFCASSLSLDLVNICQSLACLPYCKTSEQRTCLGVVDVAVDVVVVVDTTHPEPLTEHVLPTYLLIIPKLNPYGKSILTMH